jgi:hypothetical protein
MADAADVAMDPSSRAVRGSCVESYIDIFAAARDVRFEGDYARMVVAVAVTRDPKTGVVLDARLAINSASDNLSAEARTAVLEGVRKAYLRPEPEDCKGVVSARNEWVLRFGEKHALAAPDDPLMINRATAATRLRHRTGAVELVDPQTARTRLTRVPQSIGQEAQAGAAPRCFRSDLWRDFGPLPPIGLMETGARYRVTFHVDSTGRTERVRMQELAGSLSPSEALKEAVEAYVLEARFYPPVGEDCRPYRTHGMMFIGRD